MYYLIQYFLKLYYFTLFVPDTNLYCTWCYLILPGTVKKNLNAAKPPEQSKVLGGIRTLAARTQVVVVIPFILDVWLVDVPAGVTQEE